MKNTYIPILQRDIPTDATKGTEDNYQKEARKTGPSQRIALELTSNLITTKQKLSELSIADLQALTQIYLGELSVTDSYRLRLVDFEMQKRIDNIDWDN